MNARIVISFLVYCSVLGPSISINAKENKALCLSNSDDSDNFLYQSFEAMQNWVNAKINAKNDNSAQQIKNLQESLNENKRNLEKLTNLVNELRGQLSQVKNVDQRINVLKQEIKNDVNQQASTIQNIKNQLAQCITDIKVSGSEVSQVWKGPGYDDQGHNGYFVTGVSNWNRDEYPDNVHRRLISFKRNNAWTPLHQ